MKKYNLDIMAVAIIYGLGVFLLWHYAFTVDYTTFGDARREYIVYLQYTVTGQWEAVPNHGLLSSCVTTTYFPALIQRMTGAEPLLVYKWFSIVTLPLLSVLVYLLASRFINKSLAFWAALFFMSQIHFIEAPAYARTQVALIFFTVILLIVFGNLKVSEREKAMILTFSALMLVISHYGTTYMVLPLFVVTGAGVAVLRLAKKHKGSALKLLVVACFALLLIVGVWHGIVIRTPANAMSQVAEVLVTGERPSWYSDDSEDGGGFFDLATRDVVISVALGTTLSDMNTAQRVEFALSWSILLLLSYGLLLAVFKKYIRDKLGLSFVVFLLCCYLIIAFGVLAPYLSRIYGMVRIYYTALIPLSICLVVALGDLAKRMRMPANLLIFLVVGPYFLCTSGLLHSFIGFSRH